jgi:2-polyprenyl-3-methyl-5-hydroxy-6-metoxy-1,4-benzoquinol methylase
MPIHTIDGTQHRSEDFGLSSRAIELLWKMEERHFWHKARNRWIHRALKAGGVRSRAAILEVGCGSGAVSTFLHSRGYDVTGIDTAASLVRKAHERCAAATFIVGDISKVPASRLFDVVGLFDVLEHLDRPEDLLRACFPHARPGSLFIATVPAQRVLHTVIDDLSGHKRRFEAGELAALFGRVGLREIEERAIFRLTAAFQSYARRSAAGIQTASTLTAEAVESLWIDNFTIPSAPVNWVLESLCAVERCLAFDRAKNRQGASLLAIGRYPG